MVVGGRSSCLGNTPVYGVTGTSKSLKSRAFCAKLLLANPNIPFNDKILDKKTISNSKSLLGNTYFFDGIPFGRPRNIALEAFLKN